MNAAVLLLITWTSTPAPTPTAPPPSAPATAKIVSESRAPIATVCWLFAVPELFWLTAALLRTAARVLALISSTVTAPAMPA